MPSKNRIKQYVDDGYYHIYNRGVERRTIFSDAQDYSVFLSYLKNYLIPKDIKQLTKVLTDPSTSPKKRLEVQNELHRNNFHDEIQLIAYCLMPNHYHLLLRSVHQRSIERFMKSLMTRYTRYFNKKYGRVGPLFQGVYKAVLIETDEQLMYVTRYIHRNPIPSKTNKKLTSAELQKILINKISSYAAYVEGVSQEWLKSNIVLQWFSQTGTNSYKAFVEGDDYDQESRTIQAVSYLLRL